jgi:hypothetical protein
VDFIGGDVAEVAGSLPSQEGSISDDQFIRHAVSALIATLLQWRGHCVKREVRARAAGGVAADSAREGWRPEHHYDLLLLKGSLLIDGKGNGNTVQLERLDLTVDS